MCSIVSEVRTDVVVIDLQRVRYIFIFLSPFIVPPVLLQTISTLMSLLMACRKCIQSFFSY